MNKFNKNNNIAIVTINSTQNNTIFLVKNKLGKYILKSSLGLVLKKKKGKWSVASAAQLSSEIISSKLIELGYSKIYIKIKPHQPNPLLKQKERFCFQPLPKIHPLTLLI